MNFSRGCDTVMSIMDTALQTKAPPSPSSNSCGSDGYHSDPDASGDAGGDTEMVRLYRTMYVQQRNETLTALDQLTQLKGTNHLKSKILFSIIVVSVRACLR